MDISSINGGVSDCFDQLSGATSSSASIDSGVDYTKASDEELMDACKEFEAYFLEQMFKEMQKTIPKSEDNDATTTQLTDYFKDNMVQEIAKTSTDTNPLGLAQMLYEQMKRNNEE